MLQEVISQVELTQLFEAIASTPASLLVSSDLIECSQTIGCSIFSEQ